MIVQRWVALSAAVLLVPAVVITARTWRLSAGRWMGGTYLATTMSLSFSVALCLAAYLSNNPAWLIADLTIVRPLRCLMTPGVTSSYWRGRAKAELEADALRCDMEAGGDVAN